MEGEGGDGEGRRWGKGRRGEGEERGGRGEGREETLFFLECYSIPYLN